MLKINIEVHKNFDDEFPYFAALPNKYNPIKDILGFGETASDAVINLILQLNEDKAFDNI